MELFIIVTIIVITHLQSSSLHPSIQQVLQQEPLKSSEYVPGTERTQAQTLPSGGSSKEADLRCSGGHSEGPRVRAQRAGEAGKGSWRSSI